MTPKISIIVPVYNVEAYLNDCIDSILKQTYTDFEVILIDDGSTDKSGTICDYYTRLDTRIRVFHKNNEGVSSARNLGLVEAKGEWITFVDSDDWIKVDTLERIFKHKNEDSDFIQFGFQGIDSVNKIIMQSSIPDKILKINRDTYFSTNWFHSAICGYVIKTDTIKKHHITFPNGIKYGEDQAFILKALMCSHTILILNQHYYYYRHREGSAMTSSKTFSRAEDHLKVIQNISSFIDITKMSLSNLHKTFIHNFIISYITIGVDSTFSIFKVKDIYAKYCSNLNTPECYNFCKHYNSYFLIIYIYIYYQKQDLLSILVKNYFFDYKKYETIYNYTNFSSREIPF